MRTLGLASFVLLSTSLLLLGCSSESEAVSNDSGRPPADGPTFHKDVEPILQQHCQSCHAPGQIAPFSLIEYSDVKTVADLVVARTQDRSMPPWGAIATDECQPRFGWKHDARLSDAELATLDAWSKAGTPEGDPSDAPPKNPADSQGLTKVDLSMSPQKPFVASGDRDQYICFVIDPKLTEDVYVSASRLVPQNMKVAHHAQVFTDPNGESAALVNEDGYYECFGGPIIAGRPFTTWVPGATPSVFPPNVGAPLTAGTKIVLQMHYHPAGTTAEPDLPTLELQFHPGIPEYQALVLPIGDEDQYPNGDGLQPGPNDTNGIEFLIPAGAKQHMETIKQTVVSMLPEQPLAEMKLYNAFHHMHYVGVDTKTTVHRPHPQGDEPADECFLQTPKWDFNWQQTYSYDASIEALPTLRKDDVLYLRCTYDNTMDNPFLAKALFQENLSAATDVRYGESTLDEMCVSLLTVLIKN